VTQQVGFDEKGQALTSSNTNALARLKRRCSASPPAFAMDVHLAFVIGPAKHLSYRSN
jgi:hypothetical protein